MLRITMPTSFETTLLDGLERLNARYADRGIEVRELYGSLPSSVLGSGRPTRSLSPVGRAEFATHAADLQRRGFSLTYLYNGSCSANREFSRRLRGRLLEEVDWVAGLGTRSVVVASPYLIDLFRHHYPHIRVHASSICFVRSLKEADHYVQVGVRRLILDPDTVRDFAFIRRLRAAHPGLELEALANHPCLMNCPYEAYCYNSVAHGSADDSEGYENYALLRCNLDKLRDPAEFVRGSWFRPQDAHHYEAAGVDTLKLAGRGRPTEWLLRTAEAYLSRDFHGNMMDLVWEAQWTAVQRGLPEAVPPLAVEVSADSFDGFLDHFAQDSPRCREGCGGCRVCPEFAARGVKIPEGGSRLREAMESAVERLLRAPAAKPNGPLERLRESVNEVDDRILDLLVKRAAHVRDIAALKRENGQPPRDPARESAILARLQRRAENSNLDAHGIFRAILGCPATPSPRPRRPPRPPRPARPTD